MACTTPISDARRVLDGLPPAARPAVDRVVAVALAIILVSELIGILGALAGR
jgi:hypothetical protein